MSTTTHPFRAAVEARDHAAMVECLAEDVVFNSPVSHTPFEGKDKTAQVLAAVLEVFDDFRYTDELASGDVHALVFRARVGDREVQGIDLIREDGDGRIADFTVLVRPATGLMALAEQMGPRVAHLK